MKRRPWGLVLIGYMALLCVLSLAPMDSYAITPRFLVDISPDIQNLMHVPCYGLLALLGLLTFSGWKNLGKAAAMISVALGSLLFSLALELAQAFVPGRYASLTDMLFNVLGIGSALILWPLLPRPNTPSTQCPNDLMPQ